MVRSRSGRFAPPRSQFTLESGWWWAIIVLAALVVGLFALAASLDAPDPPLDYTKLLLSKLEMAFHDWAGVGFGSTGAMSRAEASVYAAYSARAANADNLGSEWLYSILFEDARLLGARRCDTDGDAGDDGGGYEFCDEWGNPIVFLPGCDTDEPFTYVGRAGARFEIWRSRGPFFYMLFSMGPDWHPDTNDDLGGTRW